MALVTIKKAYELANPCVLAPERYDPRRDSLRNHKLHEAALTLGGVVQIVRQTISPTSKAAGDRRCVVLDTSDVREGFIVRQKTPVRIAELGSQKKLFQCGDILISRLRPYLRQVALVDATFSGVGLGVDLVCSTEFFVLRSLTDEPISFLVPYLLCDPVQTVLAASQEGGHHPRFDEGTLLSLPVPDAILANRSSTSKKVEKSAALYRQLEQTMNQLFGAAAATMVVTNRALQ